MFKKKREPFTMARMTTVLEVMREHPGGVPIRYIRIKVACGRDELSTALKNLREEGLAENPIRGYWRATPVAVAVVEAPASVGVAGSYAEIHARAIAAEERAQGLAEQLAEERKRRERAEQDLRDAGDGFEQVRLLRNHLAKKARRMRKRLAELESIALSLSMIKDPTVPF